MNQQDTNIINNPHAIYYNGELIGIITNPDPHSNIAQIMEDLSPNEGLAEAQQIIVTADLERFVDTIPTTPEP